MVNKVLSLISNTCIDKDDSILVPILEFVKTSVNLEEIGDDCYNQLVNMIPLVKHDSTKALLIETIAEFPKFISDNLVLEEYIKLINQGATTAEEAARCLGALVVSGSSMHKVFACLAESLNKKLAIKILVLMGNCEWGNIPNHQETFAQEVKTAQRIRYRSGIISALLLIVHPLCLEYAYISSMSFGYPSAEVAVNDWAWVSPESIEYILERKIVTLKEANVLLELGGLLHSNGILSSEEVKKLYMKFFEGKDPIDVMFTLPE